MSTTTRFLILSDTHADNWTPPTSPVDVAIHCGDLTEESKLEEFRHALQMLRKLDAPLKLVIAGNHDWTLDTPKYQQKAAERAKDINETSMREVWGKYGEAQGLLTEAVNEGIIFLQEGNHQFSLANGARLKVFASPYTCSPHASGAFQYTSGEGHKFDIDPDADVVITHSPPKGVLDRTDDRANAGCPKLFEAVARARPRLHCFGHIHEAWGAKLVAWRDQPAAGRMQAPSALTAIDGGQSKVLGSLTALHPTKFDTDEIRAEKADKLKAYSKQNFCEADVDPKAKMQTLFVNAAIEGPREGYFQVPWIVDISLPTATGPSVVSHTEGTQPSTVAPATPAPTTTTLSNARNRPGRRRDPNDACITQAARSVGGV